MEYYLTFVCCSLRLSDYKLSMAQAECSITAPATSVNVDDLCRCVQFQKFDAAQKPPSDPAERKHYVSHGPIQPCLNKFPVTNGRSFNKLWYNQYS